MWVTIFLSMLLLLLVQFMMEILSVYSEKGRNNKIAKLSNSIRNLKNIDTRGAPLVLAINIALIFTTAYFIGR